MAWETLERFSSTGNWDPQPMKQWKGSLLRNHRNWDSVQFWWLFGYRGGSKFGIQDLGWRETWDGCPELLTLAALSLWAQTNDLISCACFFFFLTFQFLFLFFYFQRYLSSEALGISHGTVDQDQIQEREWDRQTSPWRKHQVSTETLYCFL